VADAKVIRKYLMEGRDVYFCFNNDAEWFGLTGALFDTLLFGGKINREATEIPLNEHAIKFREEDV
jgi:hypothetical protein